LRRQFHPNRNQGGKDASFTWWIYKTDGEGQYYDDYADSPVAQWIRAQYWNVKEGGIGTEENELEGWKKNEVTSFTADYDADTEIGYEDNVVFPSGTSNPLTISDWEWMFEAFEKAIKARGWENDSSSYCMSVYYQGFMQTGDLVSSFGGGTGQYYVKDGEASFDGDSSDTIANALIGQWMDVGLSPMDSDEFVLDPGATPIRNMAYDLWKTYSNTENVLNYQSLLNVEESDAYSKISTAVTDYQRQYVPGSSRER
jgi:hypothetical protein